MKTTTANTVLPASRQAVHGHFPYTVSGYKVDNRVGCWGQALVGLYVDGRLAVTAYNSPTGGPAELRARDAEERARLARVLQDLTDSGVKPNIGGEWTEEALADAALIEGEAVKDLNRRQNVVFVKSTADLEKAVSDPNGGFMRIFSKSSGWTPERIDQALAKYPGSLYWSKARQEWVKANS